MFEANPSKPRHAGNVFFKDSLRSGLLLSERFSIV